jgi:histone acetyltransferase (RNA polymerase elongator complex component)
LRLPSENTENQIFPELAGLALIRELHVYGRTFATGTDATNASTGGIAAAQHIGLGKKLMRMAQFLAWRNGYVGTAVIAGIGTQGYYARLGYTLDGGQGGFMIKRWPHIEINMLFHITVALISCVIVFTVMLLWDHWRG